MICKFAKFAIRPPVTKVSRALKNSKINDINQKSIRGVFNIHFTTFILQFRVTDVVGAQAKFRDNYYIARLEALRVCREY